MVIHRAREPDFLHPFSVAGHLRPASPGPISAAEWDGYHRHRPLGHDFNMIELIRLPIISWEPAVLVFSLSEAGPAPELVCREAKKWLKERSAGRQCKCSLKDFECMRLSGNRLEISLNQ